MTDPLVFESVADQEGFTQMPNVVLVDARLSVQARFMYVLLRKFAWQKEACWPGQATLAAVMGVTDRSVRNYLTELEQSFLISREQQGPTKPCRYVLLALGLREHRLGRQQSKPETPFRKPVSGQAGNLFPTEEDSGKKTNDGGEARASTRLKVAGKPVKPEAWALTERVLAEFNLQAGRKLRLISGDGSPSEAAKQVYGRVVKYSDLRFEDHADIIRRTLASRWWGDDQPSVGVVFGVKVFEENITRQGVPKGAKKAEKEQRAEEDMAAMRRVMERARSST